MNSKQEEISKRLDKVLESLDKTFKEFLESVKTIDNLNKLK